MVLFTLFQCECNADNIENCLNKEYMKCENKVYSDWNVCVKEQYHCVLLDCDLQFKCDTELNDGVAKCRTEFMDTFNNCKWFYLDKQKLEIPK